MAFAGSRASARRDHFTKSVALGTVSLGVLVLSGIAAPAAAQPAPSFTPPSAPVAAIFDDVAVTVDFSRDA